MLREFSEDGLYEEHGADQVRDWRAQSRREHVEHAWRVVAWVRGEDPHLPAPRESEREAAVDVAVRDLLYGSHSIKEV